MLESSCVLSPKGMKWLGKSWLGYGTWEESYLSFSLCYVSQMKLAPPIIFLNAV